MSAPSNVVTLKAEPSRELIGDGGEDELLVGANHPYWKWGGTPKKGRTHHWFVVWRNFKGDWQHRPADSEADAAAFIATLPRPPAIFVGIARMLREYDNAWRQVGMPDLPAPSVYADTPIERALFKAVVEKAPLFGFEAVLPFDVSERHDRKRCALYWCAQKRLLDWPVDFVFTVLSATKASNLVVECDGHDFHERTKAQARRDRSRDRRLQAAHYMIFRFTGSEIHSQCDMVARQILEWARSLVYEAASA